MRNVELASNIKFLVQSFLELFCSQKHIKTHTSEFSLAVMNNTDNSKIPFPMDKENFVFATLSMFSLNHSLPIKSSRSYCHIDFSYRSYCHVDFDMIFP